MLNFLYSFLKKLIIGKSPRFAEDSLHLNANKIIRQLRLKSRGKKDGKKNIPHDLQDNLNASEAIVCNKIDTMCRNHLRITENTIRHKNNSIATHREKINDVIEGVYLQDATSKIKEASNDMVEVRQGYKKLLEQDKSHVLIKRSGVQQQLKNWLERIETSKNNLLDVQNELMNNQDLLEKVATERPMIKDSINHIDYINKLYSKYLKNIKKDIHHIFNIYYNQNQSYRADRIDATKRINFIEQEKLQLDGYTIDDDLQKESLDHKTFYSNIADNKNKSMVDLKAAEADVKKAIADHEGLSNDIGSNITNNHMGVGLLREKLYDIFKKPEWKTYSHGITLKYPRVNNIASNLRLEEHAKEDAMHNRPSNNLKRLTTAEINIRDKMNHFYNMNCNKFSEVTADAMKDLAKSKEEIKNQLPRVEDKLQEKKDNKKKNHALPNMNDLFGNVTQAYQNLKDFRNENKIESEKEIDLTTARLVAPVILSFFVLLEIIYTGYLLAPKFGLGQAYGAFGGLSGLMAFLSHIVGRLLSYDDGQRRNKRRNKNNNFVKDNIYLVIAMVFGIICIGIMVWNFARLPIEELGGFFSGERYVVILWIVFCMLACWHGAAHGEKYLGHKKHIVHFKKEKENFQNVLSVYKTEYEQEKKDLLAQIGSITSTISANKLEMKKNIERVSKYREAFNRLSKQLGKDGDGLLQIYYNHNHKHRTDELNDSKRLKWAKGQMAFKNENLERHNKDYASYESFYKEASSPNEDGKIQTMIDGEIKKIDNHYYKKMADFIKQIRSFSKQKSMKKSYESSSNKPKKEFDAMIKNIEDNFLSKTA